MEEVEDNDAAPASMHHSTASAWSPGFYDEDQFRYNGAQRGACDAITGAARVFDEETFNEIAATAGVVTEAWTTTGQQIMKATEDDIQPSEAMIKSTSSSAHEVICLLYTSPSPRDS